MTHELLRPTVMTIDLVALQQNFQTLRAHVAPARVMAVVKANAYGHGLVPCARALSEAGADFFGVALVEEGIELRQAGITAPILVFGGMWGAQTALYLQHDLDVCGSSLDKLQEVNMAAAALGRRARVHIKIDTGMGRIGVQHDRLPRFMAGLRALHHLEIVGVFSHLATADEEDPAFALTQIQRFEKALALLREAGIAWHFAHLANSAAVLSLPQSRFDMVRPGIALYGVAPRPALQSLLPLRPVMHLASKVVYFKVLQKGDGVSYGHTWRAPRDTRIATIPVGYGDGFFRRLSNRGHVLIRGRAYPIVGNVCMDQMMVDLGPDGEAYNGDEVILLGQQGNQAITAADLARTLETVPHEVLTSTHLRVPRVYL